jgi:hypothetical protein
MLERLVKFRWMPTIAWRSLGWRCVVIGVSGSEAVEVEPAGPVAATSGVWTVTEGCVFEWVFFAGVVMVDSFAGMEVEGGGAPEVERIVPS